MKQKTQTLMLCSLTAAGLLGLSLPSLSGVTSKRKPAPKFVAEAVMQASGATKGLVLAAFPDANGDLSAPSTIIDVRAGTPELTPAQRAQIIVDRIQQAAAANPRWFDNNNISIGRANGEWVVKASDAPAGYIVTCDKATAGKIGMQPHEFAEAVISNIQRFAGLKKTHHKWLLKDLLTENRADAYSNILLGDHYYQTGKAPYDAAVFDYKDALERAPDSVEALEQLIAVYEKIGQKDAAEQLRQKLPALRSAAELREQADLACDAAVVARQEGKNTEAIAQWKLAIADYEKARDAAPDCLSFHLLVADTYKELADTYALAPQNESQSDKTEREEKQADAEAKVRETLNQCKNRLYPNERSHVAPQWGRQIIDKTLNTGSPK